MRHDKCRATFRVQDVSWGLCYIFILDLHRSLTLCKTEPLCVETLFSCCVLHKTPLHSTLFHKKVRMDTASTRPVVEFSSVIFSFNHFILLYTFALFLTALLWLISLATWGQQDKLLSRWTASSLRTTKSFTWSHVYGSKSNTHCPFSSGLMSTKSWGNISSASICSPDSL